MKENESLPTHALTPNHRPGHPQTVAIFQAIAEGFDVAVNNVDRRYWRSMLTVGRALDTLVDTQRPTSIQLEQQRLIAGFPIDGVDEFEAQEFSDVIHTVSSERREAIMEGLSLNRYALQMRQTRGYTNFLKLRTEEAEVFGRVMQLDNPNNTPQIDSFNAWLPKFARAGYLIDSFGDLKQDYKDGEIALRPTISRQLRIAKVALGETKDAMSDLPPRTIAFLAVASLSKMARNGLSKSK